jgi:hypothetical protein
MSRMGSNPASERTCSSGMGMDDGCVRLGGPGLRTSPDAMYVLVVSLLWRIGISVWARRSRVARRRSVRAVIVARTCFSSSPFAASMSARCPCQVLLQIAHEPVRDRSDVCRGVVRLR